MLNKKGLSVIGGIAAFLFFASYSFAQGIIIDHTAVEQFDTIPQEWIVKAKNQFQFHYQHRSHGNQIVKGADSIATALYSLARKEESLPDVANALNMYEDLFPAECEYWAGNPPVIPALEKYPSINVSMWTWCTELFRKPQSQMNNYFEGMEALEKKYPNVQFIYMTGNAQSWHGHHTYKSDSEGYNSFLDNEIIRKYCKENSKILFDFGDIDAWYNGEVATCEYNGNTFPREHDQYNKEETGHTSWENCKNKAKAFWYMMAVLAGWAPDLTPVELVMFEGHAKENGVELTWKTASESNNYGFEIERSSQLKRFQKIAFISGNATTSQPKVYQFLDADPPHGIVYYRLKQIDFNGTADYSPEIEITVSGNLQKSYTLNQNYPNPFNPITVISYSLPDLQKVTLKIYDLTGKEVFTLVDELKPPGNFSVAFDATKFRSGEYFYILKAGNFSQTKKMVLVK
ncbi:T9SS type A sorting domain-containing protein [candidate division KSB1 bacterium]|nr:T9SS type A sorting domain-containing protein [candidate division KSB1 bacterium]